MNRIVTRTFWTILCAGIEAWGQSDAINAENPLPERDIRVVRGLEVDVAPLHRWLQTREGERPLRGWQSFQVVRVQRMLAGFHHCVAKQEDGQTVEILVARMEPQALEFSERYSQIEEQIQTTSTALERERRKLEELDAVSPVGVAGPAWYVESEMAKRKRVNLEMVRLKHCEEDLEKLKNSLQKMAAEAPQRARIIAMPRGKYAGFPVWDCGVRKKQPRL